jgi:UDP-N-acetylmuramoylalanine-D-glutamate ligase
MSLMAADATTSNRIPAGKRVVILGLARQGLALARYWIAEGASVVISDMAAAEKLQSEVEKLGDLPVELALGGHPPRCSTAAACSVSVAACLPSWRLSRRRLLKTSR